MFNKQFSRKPIFLSLAVMAVVAGFIVTAWAGKGGKGGGGKEQPSYTAHVLELDFASSTYNFGRANDINDVHAQSQTREAVGEVWNVWGENASGVQAAYWYIAEQNGELQSQLIPLEGGTFAEGINNRSEIVGSGIFENGFVGLYWPNALAAPLPLPPLSGDAQSFASAINENGVICGYSWDDDWATHRGVAWRINESGGELSVWGPIELSRQLPLGDDLDWSQPLDINENVNGIAEIVGGGGMEFGNSQAVSWEITSNDDGSLSVTKGPQILGGSWAFAINSLGEISGAFANDAVIWDSDDIQLLPAPSDAGGLTGTDINDSLLIIGEGEIAHGRWAWQTKLHALLWVPSETSWEIVDLDKFLPRDIREGDTQAFAINAIGEIVGTGNQKPFFIAPK